MSADPRLFLPARSPPPPGPARSEMETLRSLVNQRLAAAVDDILEVFATAVCRYREQIDRQQRQLDSLRPEEGKWSPAADPLQSSSWIRPSPGGESQDFQLGAVPSAAHIKTEAVGESDPAGGLEARLLAECSESDDSQDSWKEAGLWRPEDTEGAEGQTSTSSAQPPPPPPPPLPPFICKVCGESFQRISYLLSHASAHAADCGLCGKHLELSESLKLHLRVHQEASLRCAVCGQNFTLRGNLRMHMRIHSGERPFSCSVCRKSFGRRATLERHVRSHTGEKPFTCRVCGHGFVEKGNLTVHLRTHTGEKPYCCSTCDRHFSQLSCFYKHPCQRRAQTT